MSNLRKTLAAMPVTAARWFGRRALPYLAVSVVAPVARHFFKKDLDLFIKSSPSVMSRFRPSLVTKVLGHVYNGLTHWSPQPPWAGKWGKVHDNLTSRK